MKMVYVSFVVGSLWMDVPVVVLNCGDVGLLAFVIKVCTSLGRKIFNKNNIFLINFVLYCTLRLALSITDFTCTPSPV